MPTNPWVRRAGINLSGPTPILLTGAAPDPEGRDPMPLDDTVEIDEVSADPGPVTVWACPEVPGPTLDRRDVAGSSNHNLSYGWTWWSARHIVRLPAGMSFLDALRSTTPVEVTVFVDVDPLDSGLNELHERYDADWCTRKPESRLLDPNDLLAVVESDCADYFRLMRDVHRREHNLPRAVVRSNLYGKQPHHQLVHDWPDGTFFQGGTARPGGAGEDRVFIEAFPRQPATFMRGEGTTFTEAENVLWGRWQRIVGCPSPTGDHEWETRGYRNGAGFCRHCNLFGSHVFDLVEIGSVCVVCGDPYWSEVPRLNPDGTWARGHGDLVCQEHAPPSQYDLFEQQWDHEKDPSQPAPDLSWMAHRLPAGVAITDIPASEFHEAHRQASRDYLNGLLAARTDA